MCGGRKGLLLSLLIEIKSVFVSGHRNHFDIRVGIEIDLISMMGSKSTWFLCAGSKLTWLWRGDRNRHVFVRGQNGLFYCVGAENTWCGRRYFFVRGSFNLVFVSVVEVDLIFVCGPK